MFSFRPLWVSSRFRAPQSRGNVPLPRGGFLQPAGSSAGLLTNAGQAINFMNPEMKSPYSVRWNRLFHLVR